MYANVTLHVYQGMPPPPFVLAAKLVQDLLTPVFSGTCSCTVRQKIFPSAQRACWYHPPNNVFTGTQPTWSALLYTGRYEPYSALPSVVSYGRPIGAYRGYEVKAAQRVAFYHSKQRLSAESRKRKQPSRLGCL